MPARTEPDLLDALARGVTIVLPTTYAARHLRAAFAARQEIAGAVLWEPPPALSWPEWTRSLFPPLIAQGSELRVLLNSAQEHLLWREVIDAATPNSLTSRDSLAEMARSAWSTAAAHYALPRLRSTAATFDSRTFAIWADSFARLCTANACLSPALLEDALRDHARAGVLRVDGPILLAGFHELTPAQRSFIDALRSSGAQITEAAVSVPALPADALRVSTTLPSPREELLFAARWLRAFLEARSTDAQPPRIALLLPNPDEHRAELDSIFREVLAPELEDIHSDPSSAPWEFVSGAPLLRQPLVSDALDLLRWNQGPLPLEHISALLRSPFLGRTADQLAAARFDAHVLRRGSFLQPELTLDELLRFARRSSHPDKPPSHDPPAWLRSVARLVQNHPPAQSANFADSAEFIRKLLKAAGFPGDREQTALEFAAVSAWDSALDLLATLDLRGIRVPFRDATEALNRILRSATVRLPGTHAPVQIMRPGDADASLFDAVVLLHATDDAWPEPDRAHPLLGWGLQQELGLPGSDCARDAQRARAAAESLLARSTHVLITTPAQDANGPLRASPLLRHLGLRHTGPTDLVPLPADAAPVPEELVPDDTALPPLPSLQVEGGATILKLQAACGFRAFAEIRLRSNSPEPHDLGLDARQRGNLVHHALEHFWQLTQSQAQLRALTPADRDQRVREAIDHAFANTRTDERTSGWSAAYLSLQRERLRRLLHQWLETELKRGPFTVSSREEQRPLHIGPLHLTVRTDRIDNVPGGKVLVDYKTGAHAQPSAWLGDRPDEPQLPLYATALKPEPLKGLFFGRIRPGKEMGWQGLAADGAILPGLRKNCIADLDKHLREWNSVLDRLAHDFADGRADVKPKDHTVNCKHCGQRLLCRLDVTRLAANLADEEKLDG